MVDDQEREAAVLECLHKALEYAVQGATEFISIQVRAVPEVPDPCWR